MLKHIARFKLTDANGNVSFIVVDPQPAKKRNCASYLSRTETPLALSNIASDSAAELRFQLEDASDDHQAIAAIRKMARYAKTVELI